MNSVFLMILLLLALAGGSTATADEPPSAVRSEDLHYRWRLEGLTGVLSRLLGLLPTTGDAVMSLRVESAERLSVEFTATSEKASATDFWKYETVVQSGEWRSLSVVETLRYKKKHKVKSFDLADLRVIDVLSGLQLLRFSPPPEEERRTIWSDGKVYTVALSTSGLERRQFDGRDVNVRRLTIRGVKEPDRHLWKARAEILLTDDGTAVPIEITYQQALGRLRLTLVDPAAGG